MCLGDPDLAPGFLSGTNSNEIIPIKGIIWELPGQVSVVPPQQIIEIVDINTENLSNIGNKTNNNIGDEFSQLISTLPKALRNLDPQFLQLIVQNESNVAFILNSDGEVDQGRIELLRARLLPDSNVGRDRDRDRDNGNYDQGNNNYRGNDRGNGSNGGNDNNGIYSPYNSGSSSGSVPTQYQGGRQGQGQGQDTVTNQGQDNYYPRDGGRQNGPGARKKSRFSGRDDVPQQQQQQQQQSLQQQQQQAVINHGPGPTFQDPMISQPYRDHGVDLGPHIPPENHQMPSDRHAHDNYERDREGDIQTMDRDRDRDRDRERDRLREQESKFPTTKAAVSCRFFNTRKGCQFGDKCPFGHFIEDTAPAENNRYGSNQNQSSGSGSSNSGNYGRDSGFYGSGSRNSGPGSARVSPGGKRNDRNDRDRDRRR